MGGGRGGAVRGVNSVVELEEGIGPPMETVVEGVTEGAQNVGSVGASIIHSPAAFPTLLATLKSRSDQRFRIDHLGPLFGSLASITFLQLLLLPFMVPFVVRVRVLNDDPVVVRMWE